MAAEKWNRFVTEKYDPLKCGSIDGTDTIPHDHAVVRAMSAKYKPNKNVTGDPKCTVFVGRLNPTTTEETLLKEFDEYGEVKRCRLVTDLVTGASKRYGFVEYFKERHAVRACENGNGRIIDDHKILVDFEIERTIEGWIPRRLGGGFGGKKEAGQLRFGGRDRPFREPIHQIKNVTVPHGEQRRDREYEDRRNNRDYSARRYDRKDDSRYGSQYRRDGRDRHRHKSRSRSRERY